MTSNTEIQDDSPSITSPHKIFGSLADTSREFEHLLNLTRAEFLNRLLKEINNEFTGDPNLKEHVSLLKELQEKLKALENNPEHIDLREYPEIEELLKKAKELGLNVPDHKNALTKADRDQLIKNLDNLRDDYENKIGLKERQKQVRELHDILKKINAAKTNKQELDLSQNEDLKQLLIKAKKLGIPYDENKTKFSKTELEDFNENIRTTISDLNTLNEMQMQRVNTLTNQQFESYQISRAILKTLHDVKIRQSKEISHR